MACDLFTTIMPAHRLHPRFIEVRDHVRFQPARELMNDVFCRMPSPDKNFVPDFQTAGFDARVWELYLFAALTFSGFDVAEPYDQPDFLARRFGETAWIEAVTANPPQVATETVSLPIQRVVDDLLPIRYGTPLKRKLGAEYWKRDHVAGKPLVIAIADFADDDPLRWSHAGLYRYLYGKEITLTSPIGEKLDGSLSDVTAHTLGKKSIESNFYGLPDAENISAVFFSNSGTVMKFSRMAYDRARYPHLLMVRIGVRYDSDPRAFVPAAFAHVVGEVPETWLESGVALHNQASLHPLSSSYFRGAVQYRGPDSASAGPTTAPIQSTTKIFVAENGESFSAEEEVEIRAWAEERKELTQEVFRRSLATEHRRQSKARDEPKE